MSYSQLKRYWDNEAKRVIRSGRHPLTFEQPYCVDSHEEHQQTEAYLAKHQRPTIAIAASGMCAGGRIMNYLKAILSDSWSDVLFVGIRQREPLVEVFSSLALAVVM